MVADFIRRCLHVLPTFLGVTLVAFALIRLVPGDPVLVMVGERHLDPEFYAAARHQLGLDAPLYRQYLDYLAQTLRLDLGRSMVTREPVWDEFVARFPATLELTFCAMLLAAVGGVLLGVLAAVRRGTWVDHGVMGVTMTGYSLPVFWWALLLILLFSSQLGWTPVSGRIDFVFDVPPRTGFMLLDAWLAQRSDPSAAGAVVDALRHLVLPSIVLATVPLATVARMTRSSLLEVLREDYVRAARSRGLGARRVLWVHALRNALIPVVTIIGLQVGWLLSGAVLTETLFAWPGVGKWLVDAIGRRDYPVVQGGILLAAVLVILVNVVVDLVYLLIDPRQRAGR